MVIGVLVPTLPGPPADRPEDRPIGRAALALANDGITVVLGDTLHNGEIVGHRALPGQWKACRLPAAAFYDRFPSQRRATVYADILANLGGRPLANSPQITRLCRDKLATQRTLEAAGLVLPPVEDDPQRFAARLDQWGVGFLKPRFGALGAGVRQVRPGDALPPRLRALLDQDEPAILQQGVPPPRGLAGRSVRVLAQRTATNEWLQNPAVVRQSATDPVVNAARGASLRLAPDVLSSATQQAMHDLVAAACQAVGAADGGDLAIELGVDVVLDADDGVHLIEINSRPRGRLEKLAARQPARFGQLHVDACARPIRTLAAWAG